MKSDEPADVNAQSPGVGRGRLRESLEDQMPVARNLTPYQKKVEAIENVILCVAEAERMVANIGQSMKSILKDHKRVSPYHFPESSGAVYVDI
jgi:hypothetical protein